MKTVDVDIITEVLDTVYLLAKPVILRSIQCGFSWDFLISLKDAPLNDTFTSKCQKSKSFFAPALFCSVQV